MIRLVGYLVLANAGKGMKNQNQAEDATLQKGAPIVRSTKFEGRILGNTKWVRITWSDEFRSIYCSNETFNRLTN